MTINKVAGAAVPMEFESPVKSRRAGTPEAQKRADIAENEPDRARRID